MLFNSLAFAIFLPLVFFLYWFVFNRKLRQQNAFLLIASYVFYGWWDWRFLSLILLSSYVDYRVGLAMGQATAERHRKALLAISLTVNLGLLGVFKYYNFFVDELVTAFAYVQVYLEPRTLEVLLPVGISFYTFQTLSYTIDVYRRQITPIRDWVVFFTYVSFFPQLVAGPIERATQLLPQFTRPRRFDYEQARDGIRQILWGLFKKMVIADSCGLLVDDIFADHESQAASTLWLGAILFAFQIYGDFSGYSDIAIGTARLFGIRLMQNFAYPYFSRDIAEFWRRWHISLSSWFRDYLYIPLGGSRVDSRWTLFRNVLIIFLVSGLWHGANWTFICWGALHALYFLPLILLGQNRRYLKVVAQGRWWPGFRELFQMAITFLLVCVAWVFFRADSITEAWSYSTQMIGSFSWDYSILRKSVFLLFGIGVMVLVEWWQRDRQHGFQFDETRIPAWCRRSLYLFTCLAILLFAPKQPTIFIYFQF